MRVLAWVPQTPGPLASGAVSGTCSRSSASATTSPDPANLSFYDTDVKAGAMAAFSLGLFLPAHSFDKKPQNGGYVAPLLIIATLPSEWRPPTFVGPLLPSSLLDSSS